MRIGLLFPSIYASQGLFPDKIFAPRELLTDLSNTLLAKGHQVRVYSVSDVDTKATVVGPSTELVDKPLGYYKFRGLDAVHQKILAAEFAKHEIELTCISSAFADAKKGLLDVIHVYHDSSLFLSHYFHEVTHEVPVVYTLHDPLPPPGTFEFHEFTRFASHNYVSISNAFRQSNIKINFVDTVYHGIDMTSYPLNKTPDDAYLFLGRLVAEKGLHNAVSAVKKAGVPLTVSVNIPGVGEENPYYESIKDQLDNGHCTVLPVVDKKHRIELYGNAKALLFPIEWEEPFGVVLIEAMACGTPVIAYNRGSVAEIIKDGITGFIIDPDDTDRPGKGSWAIKTQGIGGLAEAIGRIGEIDRVACGAHIQERFSVDTMTEGYIRVYKRLCGL